MKSVNKAIIPVKYPLPAIEELSVEFHHSTVFTKLISSVLSGIDGCINLLDDIVIHWCTKDEHNKRLQLVLDRLAEYHIGAFTTDQCERSCVVFGLNEFPSEIRPPLRGHCRDTETITQQKCGNGQMSKIKRSVHLNTKSHLLQLLRTSTQMLKRSKRQMHHEMALALYCRECPVANNIH